MSSSLLVLVLLGASCEKTPRSETASETAETAAADTGCPTVFERADVTALGEAPWDGIGVRLLGRTCEGLEVWSNTGLPTVLDERGDPVVVEELDCGRYGPPAGFTPGSYRVTGLTEVDPAVGITSLDLATPVEFTVGAWAAETDFVPVGIVGTVWALDGGWDCMGLWPDARAVFHPHVRFVSLVGSDLEFQVLHVEEEGEACLLVQGVGTVQPNGVFGWDASVLEVDYEPVFRLQDASLTFAFDREGLAVAGLEGAVQVETEDLASHFLGDPEGLCGSAESLGDAFCRLCTDESDTDCLPLSVHGATMARVDLEIPSDLQTCGALFATRETPSCGSCGTSRRPGSGEGGAWVMGIIAWVMTRRSFSGSSQAARGVDRDREPGSG